MKNTFGSSVTVTLFGESHGAAIGAVLDGMAPGIPIDEQFMRRQMLRRQGPAALSTKRREPDEVRIVSGVRDGLTTGTPITLLIENTDTRSGDYQKLRTLPRPGHADYTALLKYHDYADERGGGHFSGRITAGLVAAGAVALSALSARGIRIGTHIAACGGVSDRRFLDVAADLDVLDGRDFGVLDEAAGEGMKAAIEAARAEGDSVGGVLETAVTGLPGGVGEPWFDTVEGVLSHILFSIPAVKGVEFGDGFALAEMRGSTANDPFVVKDGTVTTATNRSGGILGGITTGAPLIVRTAVKPTPSIYKEQKTLDLATMTEAKLLIEGRHDPAIVHRARVVVDSAVALALCDLLALRFGTDYLKA
ncbi:MAG: chorismate synthase [Clostridia bacterium]|nr:chorismate synthase [Clostridia bacterium]